MSRSTGKKQKKNLKQSLKVTVPPKPCPLGVICKTSNHALNMHPFSTTVGGVS